MDPVRVPSIPAPAFPLPPRLEGLRRLAYNLYWSLASADPRPVQPHRPARPGPATATRSRSSAAPADWSRLLDDPKFLAEYHDVLGRVRRVHGERRRTTGSSAATRDAARAARSPTSAPSTASTSRSGIYSGGLGVLAGDHMKTACDMALPFVGVGLLYRKGYFRQTIDADGHQEHAYPDYDLARLPLGARPGRDGRAADGDRRAARPRPPRRRLGRPGRARPGPAARHRHARERRRRPADHPHPVRPRPRDAPPPGAGPRASAASARSGRWASTPAVWHLNEGHSAFLLAERARELRRRPASTLEDALEHGPARQRLHDPHAGLGRQRALRCRPRPARRRPAARRRRRRRSSGVLELGRRRRRRPRASST